MAFGRAVSLGAVGVLLWTLCGGAWAGGVSQYLVEGRVYVAVVFGPDGRAGEVAWTDTVTGKRGDAPFRLDEGGRLVVRLPRGETARVHVLPRLALVVESPPWGGDEPALGVSLD
ncbi:hypothetical protein [Deferrisoma camini]|uniref:hypothetical protein n=1 Tax=Deferrisoma camini TaxID=1035120 RepID=UPI00046CBE7B|nr:hypothetical protein [Deferrisoma camini]